MNGSNESNWSFFFFFWNNRQAWLMALSDHVEDEYDSSWYGIILADPNL